MASEQIRTAWSVGDRIENRWEVHRILLGGMGIMYIVYDNEARQPFAAKTFREDVFLVQPDVAERFSNEARAWIALDRHQNVTRANFLQIVRGRPLLFLEYVPGGDLSRWIGTPRLTEDPRQVLLFAIAFCDGMIHATGKGIKAHRDIKPENCLISEDGTLKITDFGLAKAFEGDRSVARDQDGLNSPVVSQTGFGAGTPTHMSPEQFDDVKYVDVRADIYSFGVLLFQMVTGKLPFAGSTLRELEFLHKRKPPPHLPASANPRLDRLVQSCLAKNPSSRPPTFGAVRQDLADIYEQQFESPAPTPRRGERLTIHDLNNKAISLGKLGRDIEALDCITSATQLDPRDTLSWVNKASILAGLGRHDEAILCCDEAIHLDANEPRAWMNKGVSFAATGRAQDALRCYEYVLALNPLEGHAWSNKGVVLADLGKFEAAVSCYRRATDLDPHDDKAWANCGIALRRSGHRDEAIVCYDRAIHINPYEPGYWFNKAHALALLQRNEEAIVCFDQSVRLRPNYLKAYLMKGLLLADMGRVADALTCIDHAIEISPADQTTWTRKADILLLAARYLEALQCYEHAIALGPDDELWVSKASILAKLGRHEEALSAFDQALDLNSTNAEAWRKKGVILATVFKHHGEALGCLEEAKRLGDAEAAGLVGEIRAALEAAKIQGGGAPAGIGAEEVAIFNKGITLFQLGRYSEATSAFERALAINPSFEQAWCNRGRSLRMAGDDSAALACYRTAVHLDRNDSLAWLNMGAVLGALGQWTDALRCFESAIRLNPMYEEAWCNKGNVLTTLGRDDEASRCYDHALGINPDDDKAWFNKANLLSKLGRSEEALASYDHVLVLSPKNASAWFWKGMELANRLKRFSDAISCFEVAARLGHPQVQDAIAQCRKLLGQ